MPIRLKNGEEVYWQAHQSTTREVPENTMVSFEYAWSLGGIPEADIRTTGDGVIICLHDGTLDRTGYDVPDIYKGVLVSTLTYGEISKVDVGGKYGKEYIGEGLPRLIDVFEAMKGHEDRLLYLDFKDVDLGELARLIESYDLASRIIFCHNSHQNCIRMKELVGNIRTMLWIGGKREAIEQKFEDVLTTQFESLDQVQLHLNDGERKSNWPYELDIPYIKYCYEKTKEFGVELEVLPFEFEREDIHTLLDMGIRWFAVDYPERFIDYCNDSIK